MTPTLRLSKMIAAALVTASISNAAFAQPANNTAAPVKADNSFAVQMLQGLYGMKPTENLVMSSTSLQTVWTFVAAAAGKQDQEIMLKAIGGGASIEEALKANAEFEGALSTRPDYTITSKNSLFINTEINPKFLSKVSKSHKPTTEQVDFREESTAKKVNDWADKSTNGLIKEMVTPDEISKLTFLALNATFLDAKWGVNFDSPHGGQRFLGEDGLAAKDSSGAEVKVDLMTSNPRLQVAAAEFPEFTVYDIPYKQTTDGKTTGSFQVILPAMKNAKEIKDAMWSGKPAPAAQLVSVSDVIAGLSQAKLDQIDEALKLSRQQHGRGFMIHIPKFKAIFTSENDDLKKLVEDLGAGSIFNRIDLAPMVKDPVQPLTDWKRSKIALIKQKATIEVSETGTKAAAVSAIGGFPESCPPPQIYVNRPFVYMVRDAATGKVVFAGTYVDPTKTEKL